MGRGVSMKKINHIEKLTNNRFLNLYHMDVNDTKGKPFNYYFVSRNDEEHLKIKTRKLDPEGIVIYAVTKEKQPRLVLIREYRYPLDDYIYALPAGLVDKDETPGEAAAREMLEETGYSFEEYTGGEAAFRRPFLMGPGFTDEASSAVFGYVELENCRPERESSEDIEVILADKEMVRQILSEEKVSLRGAYLMMQYLQMKEDEFAFLKIT